MAIWPLNYKASQYHSTLGRPNCLSQQNSTIPPGTALALQQLFSSAAFLCCYTKQAIWMHNIFPLFFCTVWFSFHTGIFFPHKHVTKVILDVEGKSANSSMHSQGTPGSTHRPVLFKAAPVGLWALSPAVYHVRVLYLIRAANNISPASPQEAKPSSDNTLLPLVPC